MAKNGLAVSNPSIASSVLIKYSQHASMAIQFKQFLRETYQLGCVVKARCLLGISYAWISDLLSNSVCSRACLHSLCKEVEIFNP